MLLLLSMFCVAQAQYSMVRLDPSQLTQIIDAIDSSSSQSQEIIDRLQAINPVYTATNLTDLNEANKMIPSRFAGSLGEPVGTIHDFEIVSKVTDFGYEHSSLPVAYMEYSPTMKCPVNPPPKQFSDGPSYASIFNKGVFHYANPKVCARRGDDLRKSLLFDFPEEYRLLLIQRTNYMWSYDVYYPAAFDGFTANCLGGTLHKENLLFRFRQLQRLNETQSFDTADYETALYNVAVDAYKAVDWTSKEQAYMDSRIVLSAFQNSGIMLRTIEHKLTNFYAGYFEDNPGTYLPGFHPFTSYNQVTVGNAIKNENYFLYLPNVTAQLITYDYSDNKIHAMTYNYPYAYPIDAAETGASQNYRPRIVIKHSNLQNTYNNTDIPNKDTVVLLAVRYYSQNDTDDCYDFSFSNAGQSASQLIRLKPEDFNTKDRNEFWIDHLRPYFDTIFQAPPGDPDSNACSAALLESVTSECSVTIDNKNYKHNNLPMISHVHDPFLAYTRHTFQLTGRPYSYPMIYHENGVQKQENRTVYVPPLAVFTPVSSYTGYPDIPYPPAFKKIYSKAESISQTVQGVINDVTSVIDRAWEIFEKFEQVLGAVESFFEDPTKLWAYAKEKGFFGSVEKALAWFARENVIV